MGRKARGTTPEASAHELFVRAHRVLRITGVELAAMLGVSSRTVVRWYGRGGNPSLLGLATLAREVYAQDPELARELWQRAARTAEAIGVPAPPPLPEPPAPAVETARDPVVTRLHTESVVHAACEAMDSTPRLVRRGLLAALARARELALPLADLEAELLRQSQKPSERDPPA